MAVSDVDVKQVYNCNGILTTFAIPFDYVDSTEVYVYKSDEDVSPATETLLTNPGDYTIVGANIVTGSAFASNFRVTIIRVNPRSQTYDAQSTTAWAPTTAEAVYDRLVRMIQELNDKLERAPQLRLTTTKTHVGLPDPAYGYVLRWASDTTNLENTLAETDFINRAQTITLSDGDLSKSVTFSSEMVDTGYAVLCQLQNTSDSSVDFQPITVTTKLTTGFTAKWNAAIDGSNYKLMYMVIAHN